MNYAKICNYVIQSSANFLCENFKRVADVKKPCFAGRHIFYTAVEMMYIANVLTNQNDIYTPKSMLRGVNIILVCTYLDTSVNIPRSILKNWPSWNIWLVWFWSFLVNEASLASRWKRSLAKIMLLNSGLLASWYGRMGGGKKWFIRAYIH